MWVQVFAKEGSEEVEVSYGWVAGWDALQSHLDMLKLNGIKITRLEVVL